MAGCQYLDPHRGVKCGAPIANYQVKMCQKHAAIAVGRGVRVKGTGGSNTAAKQRYDKFPSLPQAWRTKLCNNWRDKKKCDFGFTCLYAHGEHQLRNEDDPFPPGLIVYKPVGGAPEEIPSYLEGANCGAYAPPSKASSNHHHDNGESTLSGRMDALALNTDLVPAADVEPEMCHICNERYTDTRWLPCGHALCKSCAINWRQTTVQKTSAGTSCHNCRRIVEGTEDLQKGVAMNGAYQTKIKANVWGNPDEKARNANKIVGSTLSIDEERAFEAEARARYKEEQERRAQQEREELERAREVEAERVLREHQARELALKDQAAREQAMKAAREQAEQEAREQAAREQALREHQAREQAAREQALREQQAREQAERELAARVEMERIRMEHERQKREAERARAAITSVAPIAAPPGAWPVRPASTGLQDVVISRELEEFCMKHFKKPFAELTEFQQKSALSRTMAEAKPSRPPPGFENRIPVGSAAPFQAQPSGYVTQPTRHIPQPVASIALQPFAQPAPLICQPNSEPPRMAPTPQPSITPKILDEDDDEEETEAERRLRLARQAMRNKKNEALAKAETKQNARPPPSTTTSGDTFNPEKYAGLTAYEMELAREYHRRKEQERADEALAKKLAEEEALMMEKAAANRGQPAPQINPNRTDGKWNCAICTFENEPLFLCCAMCMNPKKSL